MRDLRPLFDPVSVAIVGASGTPGKWGNWLAHNALTGKERRRIFLVNRTGGTVLGERTYRSLGELPAPAELVVLTIKSAGFERAVDEALDAGAKVVVGITAGLGETGESGRDIEHRAAERVRNRGAVLLGPNCLGVVDTETNLNLAFGHYEPGPLALVSQSGNLALELVQIAREAGLGFSRFVSVGNQADLDVTEVIEDLAGHEATRAIAVYAEEFHDGRAFARTALAAKERGKPVLLLTVGSSAPGARAARSHTGALISASVAVDAACSAAGILRAAAPREMIDLAQAVLMPHPPRGRRLGVIGDGGGHVAVAADLASQAGLDLPTLTPELASQIGATLPTNAPTNNPVDLAGGGEHDLANYARTVRLLHESGEVDAVLLTGYFGGYGKDAPLAASELHAAEAMAAAGGPLVVHSMYPASETLAPLRSAHVPVYGDIRSAATVLGRLFAIAQRRTEIPELPAPHARLAVQEDYFSARRLIVAAGIELVEAREVKTRIEARIAATNLGYPVVLKALGASHKSDSGGVRIGLGDERMLDVAFSEIEARLRPVTWSVERMTDAAGGVEMIAGISRDHSFGPVLVIGVGGLYTELIDDVAVALAPASLEVAERMIRSLKAAPILLGARGRGAVDVAALAAAAVALSQFAAAHPEIAELEVNPLLVLPHGAIALDARVVVRET